MDNEDGQKVKRRCPSRRRFGHCARIEATFVLPYRQSIYGAAPTRVEPPIDLDALAGTLPARLPRGAWDVLREALAGRGQLDARSLLDRCLPFNFG